MNHPHSRSASPSGAGTTSTKSIHSSSSTSATDEHNPQEQAFFDELLQIFSLEADPAADHIRHLYQRNHNIHLTAKIDTEGNDITHYANLYGRADIAEALLSKFPSLFAQGRKSLTHVAVESHTLLAFYEKGEIFDYDSVDEQGKKPQAYLNGADIVTLVNNWQSFDYTKLLEPCDEHNNTPFHLLINQPDLNEGIVKALLRKFNKANCLNKMATAKNDFNRTPLQLLILSWLGDDMQSRVEVLEEIENYLPGCITQAMTEDMGGLNLLHFILQSYKDLHWNRMTGHPLFSSIVSMAQCHLTIIDSKLKVNPDNYPNNTYVIKQNKIPPKWTLLLSNYDIDSGANQMLAVEIERLLKDYENKPVSKIPLTVKTKIRKLIINSAYSGMHDVDECVSLFTTKNNENKNLVQIAIESSLPATTTNDSAPASTSSKNNSSDEEADKGKEKEKETRITPHYQITAHSHHRALESENYHLLWWLFNQYEIECDNKAKYKPFAAIITAVLSDEGTLESSLYLLDIDPSLFFRVMEFARDTLSPHLAKAADEAGMNKNQDFANMDKVLWMHERFEAIYGKSLPEMIKAKEISNVHQFMVMNTLELAKSAVATDESIGRKYHMTKVEINNQLDTLGQFIVTSATQDHPPYIRDLAACANAIREQRNRDRAASAGRVEGDLTPTTTDYMDKGVGRLVREIAGGERVYTQTFIPRYLSMLYPDNPNYQGPNYTTLLGLDNSHYVDKLLLSSIEKVFFLVLMHEDIQQLCPDIYEQYLDSAIVTKLFTQQQYNPVHFQAMAIQILLTQPSDFLRVIDNIFAKNEDASSHSDDDDVITSEDKAEEIQAADQERNQYKQKAAIRLLNAWLSIADDIYPRYKNKKQIIPLIAEADAPVLAESESDDDEALSVVAAPVVAQAQSSGFASAMANGSNRGSRFLNFLKSTNLPMISSAPAAQQKQTLITKKTKMKVKPTNDYVPYDMALIPRTIFNRWPKLATTPLPYLHPHQSKVSMNNVSFIDAWACLENYIPLQDLAFMDDELTPVLSTTLNAMNLHMLPTRFTIKATEQKILCLLRQSLQPIDSQAQFIVDCLTNTLLELVREDKLTEVGLRCVDVLAKLIDDHSQDLNLFNNANAEFADYVQKRIRIFKDNGLTHALNFANKTLEAKPRATQDLMLDLIEGLKSNKMRHDHTLLFNSQALTFIVFVLSGYLARRNNPHFSHDPALAQFKRMCLGWRINMRADLATTLSIILDRLSGPDAVATCAEIIAAIRTEDRKNPNSLYEAMKHFEQGLSLVMGGKRVDDFGQQDLSGVTDVVFIRTLQLALRFALVIEHSDAQSKKCHPLFDQILLVRNYLNDHIDDIATILEQFVKQHVTHITFADHTLATGQIEAIATLNTTAINNMNQWLFSDDSMSARVKDLRGMDVVSEKMTVTEALALCVGVIHKPGLVFANSAPLKNPKNNLFYTIVMNVLLMPTHAENQLRYPRQDQVASIVDLSNHDIKPGTALKRELIALGRGNVQLDTVVMCMKVIADALRDDPKQVKQDLLIFLNEKTIPGIEKKAVSSCKQKLQTLLSIFDPALTLEQLAFEDPIVNHNAMDNLYVSQVVLKLALAEEAFAKHDKKFSVVASDAKGFINDDCEVPAEILLRTLNQAIASLPNASSLPLLPVVPAKDNKTNEMQAPQVNIMLTAFVKRILAPEYAESKWIAKQKRQGYIEPTAVNVDETTDKLYAL